MARPRHRWAAAYCAWPLPGSPWRDPLCCPALPAGARLPGTRPGCAGAGVRSDRLAVLHAISPHPGRADPGARRGQPFRDVIVLFSSRPSRTCWRPGSHWAGCRRADLALDVLASRPAAVGAPLRGDGSRRAAPVDPVPLCRSRLWGTAAGVLACRAARLRRVSETCRRFRLLDADGGYWALTRSGSARWCLP